ncbi:hypothetical protein RclHR1_11910005 [Rhizophagus clarus]|uniref:Tyrosine-protein kinase catalytic domain-containing protein n=1 Tax=Rhizophagus clarus TaxID=94130 RepID=A0A2Z6QHX1_9GLOM|nr:hypothetical protein RclHR1_11910005 [Rhizophagus clarus]
MDQLTGHEHDNASLRIPTQRTIKPKRKRKIKKLVCNECNEEREFLDDNHQICDVCYKDVYQVGTNKVYKATWVDGPIYGWSKKKQSYIRYSTTQNYDVVLKKLNNSKDVTSKELNEIFHEFSSNRKMVKSNTNFHSINSYNVSKYFGITQEPVTEDIMIIMPYYRSGDLGISKSATESTNDNEIYGRRPFWDRIHDIELIIEICDGLRPPIVTDAPKGYIELIKECWHSDLKKRPVAKDIYHRIFKMCWNNTNPEITKSSDIGPVMANDLGAIYKSRSLSKMIRSAMNTMSTRSLGSHSITAEVGKRKFDDNQIENSFNKDKIIEKNKLIENENNDYITKEYEFDIDTDPKQCIVDESLSVGK